MIPLSKTESKRIMESAADPMFRLYRSYYVVIEMLKDREYIVSNDYILNFDDFKNWVGTEEVFDALNLTFEKESGIKIMTFWKSSLGKGDVQLIYETLIEEDIQHAIVVHVNKITPCAIPIIKSLKTKKYVIEPFLETELQINITKHLYVPRHIICSNKKKSDIMSRYGATKEQLPRILVSDPICRYYGATRGQLIKIIRSSDAMPEVTINKKTKELFDVTYRIVV